MASSWRSDRSLEEQDMTYVGFGRSRREREPVARSFRECDLDHRGTDKHYRGSDRHYGKSKLDHRESDRHYRESRLDRRELRGAVPHHLQPERDCTRLHRDYREPERDFQKSSRNHGELERNYQESDQYYLESGSDHRGDEPERNYRKSGRNHDQPEQDYRKSGRNHDQPERDYRKSGRNQDQAEQDYRKSGRNHHQPERDYRTSIRDLGELERNYRESDRDHGELEREWSLDQRAPDRGYRESVSDHREHGRGYQESVQSRAGSYRSYREADRDHTESAPQHRELLRVDRGSDRGNRERERFHPEPSRSDRDQRRLLCVRPESISAGSRGEPENEGQSGGNREGRIEKSYGEYREGYREHVPKVSYVERRSSSSGSPQENEGPSKRPRNESSDELAERVATSVIELGLGRGRRRELDNRRLGLDAQIGLTEGSAPRLDEVYISVENEIGLGLGGVSVGGGLGLGSSIVPSGHVSGATRGCGGPPGTTGRPGSRRGARIDRSDQYDNVRSRPGTMNSKTGTSGNVVNMIANFFPLRTRPSWSLFNYRVDFKPEEDRTRIKKSLLRTHERTLGGFIFDGSNMYMASRLDPDPTVLYSVRENDGEKLEITLRCVGQVAPGDVQYLQFYNIIVRSCLQLLGWEELGRHFYDRHASISMPQHRLELWPGYITTLRNYEHNLMLCVEVTHKVLRLDNCLNVVNNLKRNKDGRQGVADEFVGSVVMTQYNRKTYRVDDIAWDKSPQSTFDQKGVEVKLIDYYQSKYKLRVTDLNQPLFVSRPKKKDLHRGDRSPILLIPELCQMTGLSDEIRKNYKTMRELSAYLQQPPDRRVNNIQNFMARLKGSPQIGALLKNWGLGFEGHLVNVGGRIAPVEQVIFRLGERKENVTVGAGADWNFAFKSKHMYSSVKMTKWVIIVTQRDSRNVDNLLHTMRTVSLGLDFTIGNPLEIIRVPDTRVQSFYNGVSQAVSNHKVLDMIFIILPGPQQDLYSAVKKRCCIDFGIPSQCFLSKHLHPNAKGLMSIATKVVVQMNAKLGGEPWATNNPLKASHTMIVGFDVYHCGKRKGPSVGAMVATTNKELSRYYSTVSFHETRDDLSEKLCSEMTKCIYAFREKNENLPDRIIMYRDGVGEGQLTYVYSVELDQIRTGLKELYRAANRDPPRFTAIIVTKKGNARIFSATPSGHFKNPDAGTIVDSVITLPERYDFFLISQGSKQGTVSPTSYNVIWDEQGLEPDRIQRLTFKLCHLYYNWSGTGIIKERTVAMCDFRDVL